MSLLNGLISYWKMDETSGATDSTTRLDSVRDNDLIDINTVDSAAGVIGNAADFQGQASQEFLAISGVNTADFNFGNTDFTFAFWARISTTTDNHPFVVKWDHPNERRSFLIWHDGAQQRFRFHVTPSGTNTDTAVVTATTFGLPTINTFHFIVIWHDSVADSINIQVNDGGVDSTSYASGVYGDLLTNVDVGRVQFPTILYPNGRIDELGVWKRTLTTAEKTELYNSGSAITFPFGEPTLSGILGGYARADPKQSGFLGGYLFSKALSDHNNQAILGGYATSDPIGSQSGILGGFVDSILKISVPDVFLGGASSGLSQISTKFLGGYSFGVPTYEEFAETHARTLITANSFDAIDQMMDSDAVIIFKGENSKEFNAQLRVERTDFAGFYGKVKVEKFATAPTTTITNVELLPGSGEILPAGEPVPNFDPSGCRRVRVTASGILGDADIFTHAYIDFGEPFRNGAGTHNASISGFPSPSAIIISDHVYCSSGIYQIVARFQDNKGMIGSDISRLNLASGLIPVVDYPAISISGTPRSGIVPPLLSVTFDIEASGLSIKSPTDPDLFWNFCNRDISKKKMPISNYASPGLYAITARFLHTRVNPSGDTSKIWISDGLLIGYNF